MSTNFSTTMNAITIPTATNIPKELREVARWVMWKNVEGKKIPCNAKGGVCNNLDPLNWGRFEDVCAARIKLEVPGGVSFVFNGADGFTGIDLDDCIDEEGNFSAEALECMEKIPAYWEISPSGVGIKGFFISGLDIHKAVKGFELYSRGKAFTVTGISLQNNIGSEPVDIDWFVEKYFKDAKKKGVGNDSDFEGSKAPLTDWTIQRVKEDLLPTLKKDWDVETYDSWLRLGMILHHQGRGEFEWLSLWEELSLGATSYQTGATIRKWATFSTEGSGDSATLATLIKFVKEKNSENSSIYEEEIRKCRDIQVLKQEILPNIRKDGSLDALDRSSLAVVVKERSAQLGRNITLPDAKKLLVERPEAPRWAKDWVFYSPRDSFINIITKESLSERGFNLTFGRHLKKGSPPASILAMEDWGMRTVTKKMYIPFEKDIFKLDGVDCLNLYKPSYVPSTAQTSSEVVGLVRATIEDHLVRVFDGSRGDIDIFLSWMAHNVQFPGRKIGWAPLLKGIQGCGKTFFGRLLETAMGQENVGVLDASTVNSNFTGWATSKCVNILEEIRIKGKNRYDVMNTLKPLISNHSIVIHAKGVDPITVPNVTNYIAFTNFEDAVPLDADDRRWWIKFVPFLNREELTQGGMDAKYFKNLFGVLEHPGACRRFLLEYPISEEFNPAYAPFTEDKEQMWLLDESESDMMAEEILAEGAEGVSPQVVSTRFFSAALAKREVYDILKKRMAVFLAKRGFRRLSKNYWFQGKSTAIWVKKGVKNWESAKKILEATFADKGLKVIDCEGESGGDGNGPNSKKG